MRLYFVLSIVLILATGCGGVSISLEAPTATATPTEIPTATPDVAATATAQTQATAQASATARAIALATADAQASATAQAQATVRAQQTGTAIAQASATTQAFIAGVNALAQTGKRVHSSSGSLEAQAPYFASQYAGDLYLRNFVLEARFFNPGEAAKMPWSIGFVIRNSDRYSQYIFRVRSDGVWRTALPTKGLADRIDVKYVGNGTVTNLDTTPAGSNLLRLVVNDKAGFVFVNDQFIGTMDLSEVNSAGYIAIASGLDFGFQTFPNRYKDFTVSALP